MPELIRESPGIILKELASIVEYLMPNYPKFSDKLNLKFMLKSYLRGIGSQMIIYYSVMKNVEKTMDSGKATACVTI